MGNVKNQAQIAKGEAFSFCRNLLAKLGFRIELEDDNVAESRYTVVDYFVMDR